MAGLSRDMVEEHPKARTKPKMPLEERSNTINETVPAAPLQSTGLSRVQKTAMRSHLHVRSIAHANGPPPRNVPL